MIYSLLFVTKVLSLQFSLFFLRINKTLIFEIHSKTSSCTNRSIKGDSWERVAYYQNSLFVHTSTRTKSSSYCDCEMKARRRKVPHTVKGSLAAYLLTRVGGTQSQSTVC